MITINDATKVLKAVNPIIQNRYKEYEKRIKDLEEENKRLRNQNDELISKILR